MTTNRHQQNLNRLINERTPSPPAQKLAWSLPLSHAVNPKAFEGICQSKFLYAQSRLVELGIRSPGETHETQLGTDAFVFFFVGPFSYPETSCGFLFKADMEKDHTAQGRAVPFDSGGLLKVFNRQDDRKTHKQFLQDHLIPIPEHRDLLSLTLTHTFQHIEDYIAKNEPVNTTYVEGGDERRWTHEVQIQADIPIQIGLEAVFLERDLGTMTEIRRLLGSWARHGVTIVDFEATIDDDYEILVNECQSYLREKYL